ncbi:MAG: M23 family metallopeptidase, partial [Flavobacteriaceae bacterium]
MKKIFLFFFLISISLNSQSKFPSNYFSNPLDSDLILNGTFGELRSSHFHSGIDFKTRFKEGLKVYSSADGYVSRISIKHGGFGKALYINHPNGYTTVYAHLKNFNKEIEDYIKALQYRKKSYQIERYLKKDELKVLKNQVIGNSGNTGSSFGPHLHFETRKTSNQKALNPKLFKFKIKDTRSPYVSSVYFYKFDSLNNRSKPYEIKLKKINDSLIMADELSLDGRLAFGLAGFDRQDMAMNKNGIYKFSSFFNENKNIEFKFDSFFFEESIKIKTLIDYEFYVKNKKRIVKLFKDSGNNLSIYNNNNSGIIEIKNPINEYKIEVSDFDGNKTVIIIPIKKTKSDNFLNIKDETFETNTEIKNNKEYNLNFKNSEIKISKNTFLKDVELKVEAFKDSLKILNPYLPVFKNLKIGLFNKEPNKGDYLAVRDFKGNESFASVKLDNKNYFTVKT